MSESNVRLNLSCDTSQFTAPLWAAIDKLPSGPEDVIRGGQVIGTVRHVPDYDGAWKGEAWVTTSVLHSGEQVHRSEVEARQWVDAHHAAWAGRKQ